MNALRNIFCGLFLFLLPAMAYCQKDVEREYYEIYDACILDYFKAPLKVFYIRDSTINYSIDKKLSDIDKLLYNRLNSPPPADTIFNSLFDEFMCLDTNKNDLSYFTKLDTSKRYDIMNKCDLEILAKYKYITHYVVKTFPNFDCLYGFSKIVLSKNKDYALCFLFILQGNRIVRDNLFLCVKENDKWVVKHLINLWIK